MIVLTSSAGKTYEVPTFENTPHRVQYVAGVPKLSTSFSDEELMAYQRYRECFAADIDCALNPVMALRVASWLQDKDVEMDIVSLLLDTEPALLTDAMTGALTEDTYYDLVQPLEKVPLLDVNRMNITAFQGRYDHVFCSRYSGVTYAAKAEDVPRGPDNEYIDEALDVSADRNVYYHVLDSNGAITEEHTLVDQFFCFADTKDEDGNVVKHFASAHLLKALPNSDVQRQYWNIGTDRNGFRAKDEYDMYFDLYLNVKTDKNVLTLDELSPEGTVPGYRPIFGTVWPTQLTNWLLTNGEESVIVDSIGQATKMKERFSGVTIMSYYGLTYRAGDYTIIGTGSNYVVMAIGPNGKPNVLLTDRRYRDSSSELLGYTASDGKLYFATDARFQADKTQFTDPRLDKYPTLIPAIDIYDASGIEEQGSKFTDHDPIASIKIPDHIMIEHSLWRDFETGYSRNIDVGAASVLIRMKGKVASVSIERIEHRSSVPVWILSQDELLTHGPDPGDVPHPPDEWWPVMRALDQEGPGVEYFQRLNRKLAKERAKQAEIRAKARASIGKKD